jgi:RimJ/RimL family protein N-acetyltransferase
MTGKGIAIGTSIIKVEVHGMQIIGPLEGSIVQLVKMTEEDLPELWEIIYAEEHPEWVKWDAPFPLQPMDFKKFRGQMVNLMKQGLDQHFIIKVKSEIIGLIFYDWEHESSNSLEIGLGIYRHAFQDGGFREDAMNTWMNHLFKLFPIPRIGLTTWSGNERMITAGQDVGMMIEGRIRKSRLYRGRYYDTVKLGILREEWENPRKP